MLYFPLWEKFWAKKVSAGTELCCLEKEIIQVKSNCFSYPLQYIQSKVQSKICLFVLLYWCAGTSLLETWTSTKALIYLVIVSVLQGLQDCNQEDLGLVHGLLQGQQLGPSSECLLSSEFARFLLGPLVCIAGSHSSHTGTFFCRWMPNCCWWDIMRGILFSHVLTLFWRKLSC